MTEPDAPDRPDLADPAQLGDLFDRHGRDLYRYLVRRVGPAADDLVSETFLIALRRRHTYDPRRSVVRAWLFGIATNLVRKHRDEEIRSLRLTARTTAAGHLAVVADLDETVAARVDAQSVTRLLAGALVGMSQDDRDLLLLVSWAHLEPSEAAVVLGIPAGTVRSRLFRIRKALQAEVLGLPDDVVEEEASHA